MFFISVDRDISKWRISSSYMYSPDYNMKNILGKTQIFLKIDKNKCNLTIHNNDETKFKIWLKIFIVSIIFDILTILIILVNIYRK